MKFTTTLLLLFVVVLAGEAFRLQDLADDGASIKATFIFEASNDVSQLFCSKNAIEIVFIF